MKAVNLSSVSYTTSDTSHYENVPFEVPEGWCWSSIENVCSKFTTGPFGSMVHKSDYVTDGGVPMVNPANMIGGNISYNKLMFVSELRAKDLQRYRLEPSDILLARRGDLTKCVVIKDEQKNWLCGTGSFVLHTILLLPAYFELLYSSTYIQSILTSESVGATMDNLNQGLLGSIIIPIPPIEEQQRIVTSVGLWFSLINNLEFGYSELNQSIIKAKSKILDLAIHGKLVPQDANDEPASELLNRINPKAIATCDNPQYGKVPSSWVISTIGDVMTLKSGTNIKVRECKSSGEYPIYGGNGTNGTYNEFNVEANTIVIGRVGFYCGSVNITKSKAWVTDNALIVSCIDVFEPRFLLYLLQYLDLGKTSNSTAQPVVSGKGILPLLIPIPPIEEQHRIVSKVNELFSQLEIIEKSLQA